MRSRFLPALVPALVSFMILAGYWYSAHPYDFAKGYGNDPCNHEMARQLVAEQIRDHGGPGFVSDHVMAPTGMSLPFYAGWNIERDWIGAYVWNWNRDFPYLWAYYGVSLALSFFAVGWIALQMGLSPWSAWLFALAAAAFNLPRHMKLWYHSDNVMLHWIYAGWFLDAWIWSRLIRNRRWSISLEAWRALLLLGTFGTMGYNWGPNILEWALVRAGILLIFVRSRTRSARIAIEFEWKKLVLPTTLGLALFAIDLRWFLPLLREALKRPEIPQGSGWNAHLLQVIRPIWLDPIFHFFGWRLPIPADWPPGLREGLARFDSPETVVSIGWFWMIPFFIALGTLRKKRGGSGFRMIAPFAVLYVIAVCYFTFFHWPVLGWITPLVQSGIPFMKYFRTLCRWGLFLTPLVGCIILLSWQDLSRAFHQLQKSHRVYSALLLLFISTSLVEFSVLSTPVVGFPGLPGNARLMYERIRSLPGDTVLTFPFCVAGANGVCTQEQCPTWPRGTLTHCTRLFHDKKVYGAYTSRMNFSDCEIYGRNWPYPNWFRAWREQSCFTRSEWDGVCHYLSVHRNISALLVFPDVWRAASDPACEAELESRLGKPIAEVAVAENYSRDPRHSPLTRIRWYSPVCQDRSK